mmetsp:Transcript_71850/g.161252  ORF Transcript_71850/g.161252 Transcript_71850/m.161252 type:complete len:226 (-) Transcript_71850:133-810(-)
MLGLCNPAAHGNSSWWAKQVICVEVEEARRTGTSTDTVHYYRRKDNGLCLKTALHYLTGPPYSLLGHWWLHRNITFFTERRQKWQPFQPQSFLAYHAFTIIEVDGGSSDNTLFLLFEKKGDQLEFMFGRGDEAHNYMKEFRASGYPRDVDGCFGQERQRVPVSLTLRQLLEWMDGPMSKHWRPYSLLQANCQHFAQDVQHFLMDPGAAELEARIRKINWGRKIDI